MIARRIFAAVALVVAVGAVAILLMSGGSNYNLRLIFPDASQLVSADQVKVGGVPIGTG
jgi:ABC-type transporter Mla subunit MlaD